MSGRRTGGRPSRVRLEPTGIELSVRPGESILDAALRHGVNLPHSCRGGSCMSCIARIVSGEVGYPDGTPPALSIADADRGLALLCQAHPHGDVVVAARPIETPANIRVKRLPCRVVGREALAADVIRLDLKLPAAEPFEYLAGQYVDVLLDRHRRRSFSIANAPNAANRIELHVRHVAGGEFTARVFDDLPLKSLLRLEGPLGGFFLRESTLPALLIAGGTGFAPLKAMLEDAFAKGNDRPFHLYWGARRRADLYLDALARRWAGEHRGFRYTPVLSEPEPDWQGRRGLVHTAALADYAALGDTEVYASGPPAMIAALQAETPSHGLAAERLHFDSFEYGADTLAAIRAARRGG